jgi:hypothetical protein
MDTIVDLCRKYNIPRSTYYWRLAQGWSKEKALTTPPAIKRNYQVKLRRFGVED